MTKFTIKSLALLLMGAVSTFTVKGEETPETFTNVFEMNTEGSQYYKSLH